MCTKYAKSLTRIEMPHNSSHHMSYYANVVANASRFLSSLPHASSTTLAVEIGETFLCHLTEKKQKYCEE